MMEGLVRKRLARALTGQAEIALEDRIPSHDELALRFQEIDELGLYLHIPFCRQICPYCPYNKELYSPDAAKRYAAAVMKEIDVYADIVGGCPVTSFYIGGGTPTTMLHTRLAEILRHVFRAFNVRCDVHMEGHPNDLSRENLNAIRSMGVRHLSLGVESLQDRHLRTLKRPYTVDEVRAAVDRAVSNGFKCVNVDVIFALPGQTCREVEQTGQALVEMGVDQVAAYPLFRFPYTVMGGTDGANNHGLSSILRRRRMLRILEGILYGAGFERTSVWAFTRNGVPRYCSVTVPLYLGLGASGGTYLRDIFYLNTFNVSEYVRALENGRMPIALSLDLSPRMQEVGWLYWRVYETSFAKAGFEARFGRDFDRTFAKFLRPLALLGLLRDDGERIVLSDRGTYWLHALEDLFSLAYVSHLWGTSKREPWPERVVL